jgi:hypothetical protein
MVHALLSPQQQKCHWTVSLLLVYGVLPLLRNLPMTSTLRDPGGGGTLLGLLYGSDTIHDQHILRTISILQYVSIFLVLKIEL